MHKLEILEIEDGLAIAFPPDLIEKYQLSDGKEVTLVEDATGLRLVFATTQSTAQPTT